MKELSIFIGRNKYIMKPTCVKEYALAKMIAESELLKICDYEYEQYGFSVFYDVYQVIEKFGGYSNIFVCFDEEYWEMLVYEDDGYNLAITIGIEVK